MLYSTSPDQIHRHSLYIIYRDCTYTRSVPYFVEKVAEVPSWRQSQVLFLRTEDPSKAVTGETAGAYVTKEKRGGGGGRGRDG